MSATEGDLLRMLAVLQATLLMVAFSVLLGHAAYARARGRRDDHRLAQIHQLFDAPAQTPPGEARAQLRAAMRSLSPRLWLPLLRGLSGIQGVQRTQLETLMTEAGITAEAERSCLSRRWPRRLHAVRVLTELRAGHHAVPTLLDDPHPRVRAQALEWAAANPSPELVDRLLDLLASEHREGLFEVKDALVRIGRPTIGPLTRFLSTRRGAAVEAGLEVAVVLADPVMLPAALAASHHTATGTRAAAARLAAALGGSDVTRRLCELLDDPEPEVRTAAVRGLARLTYWPAAPRTAVMLRDPAWTVRREAALALRGLGPTGTLLLRRALVDQDAFARDAARQVLDVPGRQQQETVA